MGWKPREGNKQMIHGKNKHIKKKIIENQELD
jgi:hypothetical protein